MTWWQDTPPARRRGPRFDPTDPAWDGATATTRDRQTGELIRCDHCGDVGEFPAPLIPAIQHGTALRWCAFCLSDVGHAELPRAA